jgi:phosphoribosyl 1,2-cyclic phosphodiesterase
MYKLYMQNPAALTRMPRRQGAHSKDKHANAINKVSVSLQHNNSTLTHIAVAAPICSAKQETLVIRILMHKKPQEPHQAWP